MQLTIVADTQRDFDRPAADRTILDIVLRAGGWIDERFVRFAAVRAVDRGQLSHGVVRRAQGRLDAGGPAGTSRSRR